MADIIQFVPRPNPARLSLADFDTALCTKLQDYYNHRTIDYSDLIQATADPEMPCDAGPEPKETA